MLVAITLVVGLIVFMIPLWDDEIFDVSSLGTLWDESEESGD